MYVWDARGETRYEVKSTSKAQHGKHVVKDTATGRVVETFDNRDDAHRLAQSLERKR